MSGRRDHSVGRELEHYGPRGAPRGSDERAGRDRRTGGHRALHHAASRRHAVLCVRCRSTRARRGLRRDVPPDRRLDSNHGLRAIRTMGCRRPCALLLRRRTIVGNAPRHRRHRRQPWDRICKLQSPLGGVTVRIPPSPPSFAPKPGEGCPPVAAKPRRGAGRTSQSFGWQASSPSTNCFTTIHVLLHSSLNPVCERPHVPPAKRNR